MLWNSDQPPDRSELLKLFRRKDQVQQLLLFKRPMCLGSSVAALQALRSTGSQLSSVMLADPKQLEVSCCAAFTALTSCTFVHSCPPYYRFGPYREYTELSLQPLQALPRLSTLVLQREHLTRLQMQNAKVEASNDCVLIESLSHLHVVDWGELFGLHTLGVFSCKRLVHLYVKGGLIAAENDNHWPASLENEYEISPSLTTLTLLTCLKLHPGIRPGYPWKWTGLEYVTHLTNLQQLEIGSCRYPFTVPTGISTLSILSSLRVFSSHTAAVRLDVDCFPLHSLREVQFDFGPYVFDTKLLALTDNKELSQKVYFSFDPGSANCAVWCASLLARFKKFAPHVILSAGGL